MVVASAPHAALLSSSGGSSPRATGPTGLDGVTAGAGEVAIAASGDAVADGAAPGEGKGSVSMAPSWYSAASSGSAS
jgi:hypothetical protein